MSSGIPASRKSPLRQARSIALSSNSIPLKGHGVGVHERYVLRRRGLMHEQDADTHFDGLVGRALADGLLVLEDIPEEEDQGNDNVIRA